MNNRTAVIMVGALLVASPIQAQRAPGRGPDKPAGPQSLPGDNLPPFHMLDAQGHFMPMTATMGPPHRPPNSGPESTALGPDLQQSMRLAMAAVAACKKQGYNVGAAVVDTLGEARAMATGDGSNGSHIFVAHRKALAALAFAMPTSQAIKLVDSGQGMEKVTFAMFVNVGGLPLFRKGKLIGAIGVSGGHGDTTDEGCARAAMRSVAPDLK